LTFQKNETTIPKDAAAWVNLHFEGKNSDLDQLSQKIEQELKTEQYKTQSMKAPIGNVIQAQKSGILRGIVDANRSFSILIAGQPNDFSVHIGIGKWIQNLGVAAVETVLFGPLAIVVDGSEILWTTHVESGLAKQIIKIVG
jgi:hypothetical protein